MASETNIERSIKKRIQTEWSAFQERYKRIVSEYERGSRLHEKDVEIIQDTEGSKRLANGFVKRQHHLSRFVWLKHIKK